MKTKIVKLKGYYKLLVDDAEINVKYDCADNPIVLGCITEFFDAGQWRVEDYRLSKHLSPSPYIEDGVQQYKPKNDEQKKIIEEQLHTFMYNENQEAYFWPTFERTRYEGGDHLCLIDKSITQYNSVARFTFKTAYKLLREQKKFWDSYESDDLKSKKILIDNPHRQINATELYFQFCMPQINALIELANKNKP